MSTLMGVFKDIANSIRSKTGSSDLITPTNMANAINNISVGGDESCVTIDVEGTTEELWTTAITTFNNLPTFNSKVVIGNKVSALSFFIRNCNQFNQELRVPGSVGSAQFIICNCTNFNSSVFVDEYNGNSKGKYDGIKYSNMIVNCINFNAPVTINLNIDTCDNVVDTCSNFNQPMRVTFKDSYYGIVRNCENFNSEIDITLCNSIKYATTSSHCINNTVNNCRKFANNIIIRGYNDQIDSQKIYNFPSMIRNTDYTNKKCIYFGNVAKIAAYTNASSSVVGAAITWTAVTNGYYNATYNVYLYNNVPD